MGEARAGVQAGLTRLAGDAESLERFGRIAACYELLLLPAGSDRTVKR